MSDELEDRIRSVLVTSETKQKLYRDIIESYGPKYRMFGVIKRELGWTFREARPVYKRDHVVLDAWWIDFSDGMSRSMFLLQFEFEDLSRLATQRKVYSRPDVFP